MMFASRLGVSLQLSGSREGMLAQLFSEEAGAVVQQRQQTCRQVLAPGRVVRVLRVEPGGELAGPDIDQALEVAGSRRSRPIMLTTATTFLGLTPMIFETSMQAKFLIPMAVSLGYGIVFATAITLILIPTLYRILEDLKSLVKRLCLPGGADRHEIESRFNVLSMRRQAGSFAQQDCRPGGTKRTFGVLVVETGGDGRQQVAAADHPRVTQRRCAHVWVRILDQ